MENKTTRAIDIFDGLCSKEKSLVNSKKSEISEEQQNKKTIITE